MQSGSIDHHAPQINASLQPFSCFSPLISILPSARAYRLLPSHRPPPLHLPDHSSIAIILAIIVRRPRMTFLQLQHPLNFHTLTSTTKPLLLFTCWTTLPPPPPPPLSSSTSSTATTTPSAPHLRSVPPCSRIIIHNVSSSTSHLTHISSSTVPIHILLPPARHILLRLRRRLSHLLHIMPMCKPETLRHLHASPTQ